MRKLAFGCLSILLALPLFAGDKRIISTELNPTVSGTELGKAVSHYASPGGFGNLVNHGGPVQKVAHVVFIFWGWSSNTTDSYISETLAFRNSANGMVTHMGMLTQYGVSTAASLQGSQADVFDAVPPASTKVTDAMVQAEVNKYFGASYDANTTYEVLIPSGYYSDDGSGNQSCGGTNLKYCAYHSHGDGANLPSNCKYSIQPYPSCSGCHGLASWTAANDQQHFIVHETRESFSDPMGNAWYDWIGYEADDKCAWGGSTLAFLFSETTTDGHTFGYQMEYSNSARNCVK